MIIVEQNHYLLPDLEFELNNFRSNGIGLCLLLFTSSLFTVKQNSLKMLYPPQKCSYCFSTCLPIPSSGNPVRSCQGCSIYQTFLTCPKWQVALCQFEITEHFDRLAFCPFIPSSASTSYGFRCFRQNNQKGIHLIPNQIWCKR